MAFQKKADRSGLPVKGLIDGPSGSGKTYTALEIATGLVEGTGCEIGVVDSQNGQSLRYAGIFDFYAEIIRKYDPQTYIDMIRQAEAARLGVLIVDSATHEWSYCLEIVDQISKRTGSSNNAWREVTPAHKRFVEAIVQCTIPLIVTVRTKTDWLFSEEQRGNRKIVVPKKMGTKPEQRDQFEFEYDFWLRMGRDHTAGVEKSVFPFMETDTDIGRPTREHGRLIRAWFEGTTFDAEAAIAEREQAEAVSGSKSTLRAPAPATDVPSARRPAPAPDGPMAGQNGLGTTIIDPETLPAGATDDLDEDDASAEDDEDEDDLDEDDEERRTHLYARYRTLAAVAVVKRHQYGLDWAAMKIEDYTDAELLAEIEKLEGLYPNVKETGAYQCSVCGTKIYPHVTEEYQGHTFPGLQLIAISVRDFQRVLCAKDLATERTKARRRAPAQQRAAR